MDGTPEKDLGESENSRSASPDAMNELGLDERDGGGGDSIALPFHVAGSGTLDRLVDTARDYAKAVTAENTSKAYAADWKHTTRWCRHKGINPLPHSPAMVGLYLTDLATPTGKTPALSVSTVDRRPPGLAWNYVQRISRGDIPRISREAAYGPRN